MSNDLKLNDAVRVKETFGDRHYHGVVGYVFDLGEPREGEQLVRVTEGYVGVCFDMDNTHRSPHGFKPEDLEKVGDYEAFARFSLGYAVTNAERFSDGFDLMKLAYQTWNKVGGTLWVDERVKHLHEFLEAKYAIRIPRPWDDIPLQFEEILTQTVGGAFKSKSVAEFNEAILEAAGLREDIHNQIWTLLRITYPDAMNDKSAFIVRKYVGVWRALKSDVYRDPKALVGELASN